ncbi:tape measure protein [Microbacterium phage IAmGroot]|uniref:Tape measure protein n=1 Tax=Microbacterium phage IAmGroot TaxID=2588486 RepID=A0A4Y6EGK6_9CAUD|nr:tape measure protein [Microbacterium phage IAmGroot]
MAENVGYATLNVIPSAKGFGKALKGDLDPALASSGTAAGNTLGSKLKAVAGPLFALAGTVAMGAFVKNAISEAGKLEQSIGAINSVFKESATQVHGWAVQSSTAVGLNRNEYNELATLIGSQLKNAYKGAGKSMAEIAGETDNLITLGADLSSMFGGTSREAVEALSSALKGERDPIERYGVSLKQAAIDAKAAEMGFQKVDGALTNEANAAATLALIMEQTADAHGNFAKESTTYEGVMQRLRASWDNITATIGAGFLPFATAAGSILLGMMPTVQGLADNFATFGERMTAAFQDAGGGLAGVQAMFQSIFTGIGAWISGGGLQAILTGWQTAQLGFINAVVAMLPMVIEALIAAIPVLVAGFVTLLETLSTTILPQIITSITTLITAICEQLPALLAQLSAAIVAAIPLLLEAGIQLFTSLVTSLATALPEIIASLLGALTSLAATVVEMLPTLLSAGIELFMALVQAIVTVLPDILNTLLTDVLPNVLSTVLGMLPQLLTAGVQLFFALVQAIIKVLPEILRTLLIDVLPNVLRTVLGMLPQLLSAAIDLFFALVTGILTVLPSIIQTLLTDVLPAVLNSLVRMLPELIAAAIELFGALVTGIVRNIGPIVNALITQVIPAAVRALISAVPSLVRAGIDLINGLIRGLKSMAQAVGNALLNIIKGAVDGFLGFLGIKSPSRLFKGFGVNVGEGLAIGIESMESDVAKSALGLANAAADAVDGMSLGLGADVSGLIPEGGVAGSLATAGTSTSLAYTQIGGQGLTAEQELVKAARRLKHVI